MTQLRILTPEPQLPTDDAKLRGGYYTPDGIVTALAEWATGPGDSVLEPSAGDGAFVAEVARRVGTSGRVVAIEQDREEAAKIARRRHPSIEVVVGDASSWFLVEAPDNGFDAVVGNPPFIRYQSFPERQREAGFSLMREVGLAPNRLTNAWVPFVVLATRALRPGGRLAMVLPAELLQVTYAGELRSYLARNYSQLTIVTFRQLVFKGIQQETLLVLGTRAAGGPANISFVELDDIDELVRTSFSTNQGAPVDLDHAREKWTQYYLSPSELGLIREVECSSAVSTIGAMAEVDVGMVTGRNEFFVLKPSEARRLEVEEFCLPLVGRSAQIPGLVLRSTEFEDLCDADSKCSLLALPNCDYSQLTHAARVCVDLAEQRGWHTGYKCRIRQPRWWTLPSAWAPDAFLLRQIHDGPRIVANQASVTCTDTIHRMRARDGTDPSWLAAASLNSLTWAFAEIRGRSYGGGVLELEPTEAERLPFPRPDSELPLNDLDLWARQKDPEQVLNEVDRLVLFPAGFTAREATALREIWRKLSSRRLNRKRRRSS